MPQQVGSDSNAAAGVPASGSDAAGSTERQTGSNMPQAAQLLGTELVQEISEFSRLETRQSGLPQPIQGEAGYEHAAYLRDVFANPVCTDSSPAFQNIDPEGVPANPLQLQAKEAMASVNRLKALVSNSFCSESGIIDLTFIEQYCGLVDRADEVSPRFFPRPEEESTAIFSSKEDFTQAVIEGETLLYDSILDDIRQCGDLPGVSQETQAALAKVCGILGDSANLTSRISRKALFYEKKYDLSATFHAASVCWNSVTKLPNGEALLIPLVFRSKGISESLTMGHITYMVVEKNSINTVNLHLVNRGEGHRFHRVKPGEVVVDRQDPKKESAVSKWNVRLDKLGGLEYKFFLLALMLTLDAKPTADGLGVVQSFRDDPNQQRSINIDHFYNSFCELDDSGPPAGYEPIYQRPQKDSNCGYSNLKASIRYLLRNPKIYNRIDLLKTEKVAQLTLEHMTHMINKLLQESDPDTARLKRYCFVAQAATDKLLAKHNNALRRIGEDNGVAKPSDSPPHL